MQQIPDYLRGINELSPIIDKIEEMDKQLGNVYVQDLTGIKEQVTANSEAIAAIEGGGSGGGTELADLQAQVQQNRADIDAFAQAIANLNSDLGGMFNRLNQLEGQVNTNVGNLNNIGDRLTALEAR